MSTGFLEGLDTYKDPIATQDLFENLYSIYVIVNYLEIILAFLWDTKQPSSDVEDRLLTWDFIFEYNNFVTKS